jgi:hypothetical protein
MLIAVCLNLYSPLPLPSACLFWFRGKIPTKLRYFSSHLPPPPPPPPLLLLLLPRSELNLSYLWIVVTFVNELHWFLNGCRQDCKQVSWDPRSRETEEPRKRVNEEVRRRGSEGARKQGSEIRDKVTWGLRAQGSGLKVFLFVSNFFSRRLYNTIWFFGIITMFFFFFLVPFSLKVRETFRGRQVVIVLFRNRIKNISISGERPSVRPSLEENYLVHAYASWFYCIP